MKSEQPEKLIAVLKVMLVLAYVGHKQLLGEPWSWKQSVISDLLSVSSPARAESFPIVLSRSLLLPGFEYVKQ